jgi:hypothetical protein
VVSRLPWLSLLAGLAAPAWSCSCLPPLAPAQLLQPSALVAVGRVQAVRPAMRQDPMQVYRGGQVRWDLVATPVQVFELQVQEAFTGASVGQTVSLQTAAGPGDCGQLAPQPGETLLLVARPVPAPAAGARALALQAEQANRGLPVLEALGGRCAPGGRLPEAQDLLDGLRRLRATPPAR